MKHPRNPYLTVDAIIEIRNKIVIIQRKNPPLGYALPGGFVDYGESLENAIRREIKEETSLDVYYLKQFHSYSDPKRDLRFHVVSVVFSCKAYKMPKAGDDAANVKVVKRSDVSKIDFAFDHKQILLDYFKEKKV